MVSFPDSEPPVDGRKPISAALQVTSELPSTDLDTPPIVSVLLVPQLEVVIL